MTRAEIAQRGTEICRRLAADVDRIAPAGIGGWDRAWEIVAPADADFVAAVSAWQADPTNDAAKEAVRTTYAAVLDAWRATVAEYKREGARLTRWPRPN